MGGDVAGCHTCVLEENVGTTWTSGLNVDEGTKLSGKFTLRHVAMGCLAQSLLAAIESKHDWRWEVQLWVCQHGTSHLNLNADARSTVRRACEQSSSSSAAARC